MTLLPEKSSFESNKKNNKTNKKEKKKKLIITKNRNTESNTY